MKYCDNCGGAMSDDALFCSACGARVSANLVDEEVALKDTWTDFEAESVNDIEYISEAEGVTQPVEKTDIKPKDVARSGGNIGIIVTIVAFVLVIVSSVAVSKNTYDNETTSTTVNEKETVNFDLSKYARHGELSEGRIWVVKEESDWDSSPSEKFAYLDENGKVIYGWEHIGTYYSRGYYVNSIGLSNFHNGFAFIYDYSKKDKGYVLTTVIDTNGDVVAKLEADFYSALNGEIDIYIEGFNSSGYAYFIGNEYRKEEKGLFFVDSSGVHEFEFNDNSKIAPITLENIRIIDDKYFYISLYCYQLFDLDGNLVLDFREDSEVIPDSIEIINDKYIEARFKGKDEKYYICVLNFSGNFVKEPVLASKYKRDGNLE